MKKLASLQALFNEAIQLELRLYDDLDPESDLISNKEFILLLSKWHQSQVLGHVNEFAYSDHDFLAQFFAFVETYFHTAKKRSIHPQQLMAIKLAIFYFTQLKQVETLEPRVFELIRPLTISLIKVILVDFNAVFSSQGFFRSLIFILLNVAKGYDTYTGARFNDIVIEIGSLIKGLANLDYPSAGKYQHATDTLLKAINLYLMKVREFETKLCKREQSLAHAKNVKEQVDMIAHRAMAGKAVPVFIVSFLQDTWSKYLYITYLRDGVDSNTWQQGVAAVDTLVWSVTTEDFAELRNRYATKVISAHQVIRDGLATMHHQINDLEIFFERIESEQMARISGEPMDSDNCIYLPEHDEEEEELEAIYPLFKRIKIGDWLSLFDDGKTVKAKVIDKNTKHHYVLFANYSGAKVACYPEHQFESMNEQGFVSVLQFEAFFDNVIEASIEYLQQEIIESSKRKTEQDLQKRLAKERQAIVKMKEQERLKEEAKRLAQETHVKEQEQQQLKVIAEQVEALQVGAKIEFSDDNGKVILCKLSLILSSTEKLVFIDKQEQQHLKCFKLDLVHLIHRGKAKIVDQGSSFEDSLQNIVLQRRETLLNRE